ncbi:MAG: sugar ABC transporter permease, partial [Oscillospiraceae bacterium]|nr:sugar ABC transporter permease [Oscillospiraceae bacterium]
MKKPYRLAASFKQMRIERTSYLMIAPFLIAFFIFTVLPVVAAIALSFTDFNMLQTPNWVGFDNYKTLFLNDDVFIIA